MPLIAQGKTNVKYLSIVIILAVLAGVGIFLYRQYLDKKESKLLTQNQVVCTQEAKICPDGSSVGRIGPNCEFAACPVASGTDGWQTYGNERYSFEIKYPSDFVKQKIESDATLLTAKKTDGGRSDYFSISIMKNYKIDRIVPKVEDLEEISIGEYSGYKYFYIEGAGMSEAALIQVGQDALSISLDNIGGGQNFMTGNERKDYVQSLFDQIISTIKFIN